MAKMSDGIRVGLCLLAGFVLTAPPSLAVVVSGTVVSETGTPLQDVDLDWYNRDLDQDIDPSGDHTDANGNFQVVIPEGEYDIQVIGPPASTAYAPIEFREDIFGASVTLPPITLPDGALITVHVESSSGASLMNRSVRYRDTVTGDDAFLLNGQTGMGGNLSSVIPLGTYDVIVEDDAGAQAPEWQQDVVVSAPATLPTFVLRTARILSGRVVDDGNAGIFNVDLDVVDLGTGEERYTPGDNTDFLGDYSVAVPDGTYDIFYTPVTGSPFAPEVVREVVIDASVNLGTLMLEDGLTVSGTVLGSGATPLANVNVDVVDVVTGLERYTPGDDTNASGQFSVVIPAGTYDFSFSPPAGVELAAGVEWDFAVTANTVLPTQQLVPGVRITGVVTGDAVPIEGADLDFVVTSNGKMYPTPRDDTDALGQYAVRVMPDTYDVTARPPAGSGYLPLLMQDVALLSDTVLNFELAGAVAVGDATGPGAGVRLVSAPNPFRSSTSLTLQVGDRGSEGTAVLSIYDVSGRLVRTFQNLDVSGGELGALWDGRDSSGRVLSPGAYFVRARGEGWSVVQSVRKLR